METFHSQSSASSWGLFAGEGTDKYKSAVVNFWSELALSLTTSVQDGRVAVQLISSSLSMLADGTHQIDSVLLDSSLISLKMRDFMGPTTDDAVGGSRTSEAHQILGFVCSLDKQELLFSAISPLLCVQFRLRSVMCLLLCCRLRVCQGRSGICSYS